MAGIMDFFRGNSDTGVAQNQSTPQPQPQQPQNPAVGPDGKMPGSSQEPVNPLDAYAKMFEKATEGTEDTPPSFSLDPKVLGEVSSKLNFTQDVSPELMQQATAGDMNALIQVMNTVGQNAYKASLSHTSTLTDKFVGARTAHELKSVGPTVRKELTNSALASTPNYNHPVVKQQLNMVAESFARQHPDATPAEIAQMAGQYIQDLAAAINPQATTQQQQNEREGEIDWSKYLS